MVQSLEAIKGGGGSIRVGTTGTISSLMTRELDSMKTPTRPRKSSLGIDQPSSSRSCTISNLAVQQEICGKKPKVSSQPKIKSTHTIPMLGSDGISFDRTPVREKRGNTSIVVNIVEVVDIKCGTSDTSRAWTVPITSRLKKLGFSKLSDHHAVV